MPLVKSVSGIRGTIGGIQGENLTPPDIIAFTSAYGAWLLSEYPHVKVVIGRDGRISGSHVNALVTETLQAMGIDVIDVGLSTTPAVEMYVPYAQAQGGIVITASHNPAEWNALKFLNARGEFISESEGKHILSLSAQGQIPFAALKDFGTCQKVDDAIAHHIDEICKLELVDLPLIRKQGLHVAVDCINSTGALAIPALLEALGCSYSLINEAVTGDFAHNPEPLAEHLTDLCQLVKDSKAAMGIAVDPDVDRLALVDASGAYFGEEYTLVAVADHVLRHQPGPCVSNLSSSRALEDLAKKYGQEYTASKVGEVHVVLEMKRTGAVIGGEGNGGIIYPPLHYGRDALVGIALLLTLMAESGQSLSTLKASFSQYTIAKRKLELGKAVNVDTLFDGITGHYPDAVIDRRDGLKLLLADSWLHLRASNTEPVIRVYAEAGTESQATALAEQAIEWLRVLNPS